MRTLWMSLVVLTFALTAPYASNQAYADSQIDADFEGTLIITSPTGEISILEAGDPVPSISKDSTLEVFEGEFTVTTTDGVAASCLEHDIVAGPGVAFILQCGKYEEDRGLLTMVNGTATVTQPDGVEVVVTDEFEIYGAGKPAAPTAAGGPSGLPLDDPRNDETSPGA